MDFAKSLETALKAVAGSDFAAAPMVKRAQTEINLAAGFAGVVLDKQAEWQSLILRAAEMLRDKATSGGAVDMTAVVTEVEAALGPIGNALKDYTIHCVGHAHIDMNWLWPWQETVSASHDTFSTVEKLMEQFPELKFSQSQASIYAAMEEYCPEVFENIKKRVAEGRWESMASMWVEGDKNLASGEILCRHLLYTRRYFKEKFGQPYDAVKIGWECDTFGHCATLPSILNRGGVSRYYRHRTGPEKWLLWWEAQDGSRVLAFYDKGTYNGTIDPPNMGDLFTDYVKETGLKDFMFVYGVGDHGGGPTRLDLIKAAEIDGWPIFPNVKLSTTDAFFSAVEPVAGSIAVWSDELNFVFEGCYTSQSSIKTANRVSENVIPEVEAISVLSGALAGFPYPQDEINKAWRLAMFNQFHDILPGSGVHETYTYANGLFQEILATTGAIRTRALRRLAAQINTSKASGIAPPTGTGADAVGDSLGAGVGDPTTSGGMSAYSMGAASGDPVVVFNHLAFKRSAVVEAKVWNKELPYDRIVVRDETGQETPAQAIRHGDYWGHKYITVAFPVENIPAMGHKVFTVDTVGEKPAPTPGAVTMPAPNVMENEFVRVEIDKPSGAIKHLIDKSTGYDLVPDGELLGLLEVHEEANKRMSSWVIGDVKRVNRLDQGGFFEDYVGSDVFDKIPGEWGTGRLLPQAGPNRARIRTRHNFGDSLIVLNVSLSAGSPVVEFDVKTMWLERGSSETIPMLRVAFPTRVADPKATYEIAFGSKSRAVDATEVPALRWADLSGSRIGAKGECGITLVNADKYGHSADGSTLRLTLLRSSTDPDPLPEMGRREIKFAIIPHDGMCSISDATRAGAAYNLPMNVASTDIHEGPISPSTGYLEVLDSNVMLASIKKAEDGNALVVRLYEVEGKATEARVRMTSIVAPNAPAVEVDLLEQPLAKSAAKMAGDTLIVSVPAYGISTVKIG